MSDRPGRRAPLFWRVLAASFAVVAVLVIAGGWLVSRSWERQAREQTLQTLSGYVRIMAPEVRQVVERAPGLAGTQPLAEELGRRSGCRVTIVDRDGRVLGDSERTVETVATMDNHADRPEIRDAIARGLGTSIRRSVTLNADMLYLAAPVAPGGSAVLRLSLPLDAVSRTRREIRGHVAAGMAAGLLLASLLSTWLTLRLTRPLSRLARVARSYASGDLGARATSSGFAEVDQLGETLHSMADSIRDSIEQLTNERNEARVILDSLVEGVIAVDQRGRILEMNPAACGLLGLGEQETAGRNLFEVVRIAAVREVARDVLGGEARSERRAAVFAPEERVLHVQGLACGPEGTAGPRAVVVLRDRTELDRYEGLRREFVANVSHELKSPLTSIRGLAETLLDGAIEDERAARRFVGLIDVDAERLSRLIDDLLSLSQIESQQPPLPEPVEIRPLIESVLETLRPSVDRRHLSVTLDLPAGLRARALPDRLRQVFWNLLDNAIKYNRDGGRISVTAGREDGMVRVSVADTGVGIPEPDQTRIFERFYRVDKARSRDLGGTGLGLSIVKHIVEAQQGTVRVESRVDQGSVFSITLPAAE